MKMQHPRIPSEFFAGDAVALAPKLLGKVLSYDGCSGMIVETEAYRADPASHAAKRTPRSEIMYSTHGHWYIYFIYGMYYCINITTNRGEAGAVLVRAVEPLEGVEKMKKRRGTDDIHNLCSGPGKLCGAFGIDKKLNGTKVNGKIFLSSYKTFPKEEIGRGKRVGISVSNHLDWRFYVKGNKFVSRMKG